MGAVEQRAPIRLLEEQSHVADRLLGPGKLHRLLEIDDAVAIEKSGALRTERAIADQTHARFLV